MNGYLAVFFCSPAAPAPGPARRCFLGAGPSSALPVAVAAAATAARALSSATLRAVLPSTGITEPAFTSGTTTAE